MNPTEILHSLKSWNNVLLKVNFGVSNCVTKCNVILSERFILYCYITNICPSAVSQHNKIGGIILGAFLSVKAAYIVTVNLKLSSEQKLYRKDMIHVLLNSADVSLESVLLCKVILSNRNMNKKCIINIIFVSIFLNSERQILQC